MRKLAYVVWGVHKNMLFPIPHYRPSLALWPPRAADAVEPPLTSRSPAPRAKTKAKAKTRMPMCHELCYHIDT